MSRERVWLRLATTILAANAILTLVYGGFLPTPIFPDVGVVIPLLGRLTLFWSVVGVTYLAAAVGVAQRRRWGRALATVATAGSLAFAGAGLLLAVARADLAPDLGALVGIGLDMVVLYAVLRKWLRTPLAA